MKNKSVFDSLKKQQLLREKIITPPMVEQIKQQNILTNNVENFVMGSSFLNVDTFSSAVSVAMKADISQNITGMMGHFSNIGNLIENTYNSIPNFDTLTNNYLGVMGIEDNWANVVEMSNSIQNLVNNTNYSSYIGASAVLGQNISTDMHQDLLSTLNSFTQSDRFSSLFKQIDWGSLDEIDFDRIDEETEESDETKVRLQGSSELSATVTVTSKKKLSDLTVDEFEDMIRRAVKKTKTLSLGAFFGIVFNDYIKDAALVITEVFVALMISISVGSYNAEVKEKVQETIVESKTVRDVKKVFIKYTDIPPVIGEQIAFLRTNAVLREGRSNTAPGIEKVSEKTVLYIIGRKGNWLQVQIETETECYIGWVEESKVVKFKKVE
ncbi:hypothetical protein [Bacillus sp. FJAT-45350]|uniref:hypothetical protein n=1 Tax=Bacillus sp. FJAT-45350 TaxID=2011014 RepID=UPI000BB856D3|nr:hypothetical protein [Bacillus sp. FJAT-45350]